MLGQLIDRLNHNEDYRTLIYTVPIPHMARQTPPVRFARLCLDVSGTFWLGAHPVPLNEGGIQDRGEGCES